MHPFTPVPKISIDFFIDYGDRKTFYHAVDPGRKFVKIRESGMPDKTMWEKYLEPEPILRRMGLTSFQSDVADLGCGYGTFTLPAARIVSGTVYALDIEPEMVETVRRRSRKAEIGNIRAYLRDFMSHGTGRPDQSIDHVMIYNILHGVRPEVLLREAFRILVPGGRLSVIHWIHDPDTPRGPPMEIRPKPEECMVWAEAEGFHLLEPDIIELPPYHYGLIFYRPWEPVGEPIRPQAKIFRMLKLFRFGKLFFSGE